MSDEVPQGWATAKLNDVVSFALGGDWGKDPDESTDGLTKVRVIRGTEFRTWRDEKGASAAERRIMFSSLEKRRLQKGDLVLEVSGGGPNQPVGRTVLIDDEALRRAEAPLVCSNFFRLLRLQPEVDSDFISHFLSYAYARGAFNEFQTETTNLRNLNVPDFLEKTEVALAPLAEQRRIVAKLETLLGKVDASQQRLAKIPVLLKRFRQAVLAAACSGRLTADWREENPTIETAEALLARIKEKRLASAKNQKEKAQIEEVFDERNLRIDEGDLGLNDIPDTWLSCRVGAIGAVCNGSTPSRKQPEFWNGAIPWVSSGEVRNNLISETRERITKAGYEGSSVRLLPRGSVLIAMIGEGKTRGQTAILNIEATINQNIGAVVLDHGLVSAAYLWRWFQLQYEATRERGSGSGPQALNCQRVRELPFVLPPLPEQQEIVRRVESLFSLADQLEARLSAAQRQVDALTPSLLARAFRGQLVPQDPNDEPASALLERIRKKVKLHAKESPRHRNHKRCLQLGSQRRDS